MARQILDTDQKALEINLDEKIYGTFAEIGAGQEVARIFFKVGAAAGTIAKSISAYDKTFSDRIYGETRTGRYVCESRLYRMLDYEYQLMVERLEEERPNTKFFVFSDTIAALNYNKTIKGNGWIGVRFQIHPGTEPNDLILHVKMLDHTNQLQQSAIGTLGVNMIYACYHLYEDPEEMLCSLVDGIEGRVQIDLIRLSGPDFKDIDNRLLCLMAVENGLTDVTMFGADGQAIHPSEFLYKKSLIVVRGNFRPPTLVTEDVFDVALDEFAEEPEVDPSRAMIMAELTLEYLSQDGTIDRGDFLSRAELLCAMNKQVIVSRYTDHQSLMDYLSDFRIKKLALLVGVRELCQSIVDKYREHKDGKLLTEFGNLFSNNIRVYVYPALFDNMHDLMTLENMPIPEEISFLVKFLIDHQLIVQIKNYNQKNLDIIPNDVYKMIRENNREWENYVSPYLVSVIKDKGLFGLSPQKIEI